MVELLNANFDDLVGAGLNKEYLNQLRVALTPGNLDPNSD
jgi:hypothetical protein